MLGLKLVHVSKISQRCESYTCVFGWTAAIQWIWCDRIDSRIIVLPFFAAMVHGSHSHVPNMNSLSWNSPFRCHVLTRTILSHHALCLQIANFLASDGPRPSAGAALLKLKLSSSKPFWLSVILYMTRKCNWKWPTRYQEISRHLEFYYTYHEHQHLGESVTSQEW